MKRMSKTEYRAKLTELGLTQVAAAQFLDFSDRTSRRYASGEDEVPYLIARFLRLVARLKMTPSKVLELTDEP